MPKNKKNKLSSDQRRDKALLATYSLTDAINQIKQTVSITEGKVSTSNNRNSTTSETDFSFLKKELVKVLVFVIAAVTLQILLKFVFKI
ncbi:MAG TPA: hypothetical protein VIK81_02065 [Patescibacteria group bacterium]